MTRRCVFEREIPPTLWRLRLSHPYLWRISLPLFLVSYFPSRVVSDCHVSFHFSVAKFGLRDFVFVINSAAIVALPMNGQGWRLIPSLVNRCLTQTSPRYLSVRNNSIPPYKSLHTATVRMAHNLPNLVKPTHYDVTLYNFDFEKFTFSGDVSIRYPAPQSPLRI